MKRFLILIVLAVVTVTACGDDDSSSEPDAPRLDILLEDFEISPGSVSLPAGAPVNASVSNLGGIEHNWTILTAGPDVATAIDLDPARIMLTTADLQSGETESVAFTAPEPGTYQIICTVPGHVEAGMTASLVVGG